ncbi:hypothetical protein DM01DRAFT_1408292 [Hesseltinella vesiculosa]|uniref:Uncharacterized protein n=1 Tax=Hesseltinella vesiculosa TaxID=101127 RepID=A0A1X2GG69_9FUNG|nr:hypothetical protein DM01DRAFT_1408292 [Hesseltinella vesiculosa]
MPLPNITAVAGNIYEELVLRFGCPREILSNHGSLFMIEVLAQSPSTSTLILHIFATLAIMEPNWQGIFHLRQVNLGTGVYDLADDGQRILPPCNFGQPTTNPKP